jgi:RNA polymerase sigma-70 factor (ECF subfamily)
MSDGQFHTTRWSLVIAAPHSPEALAFLCQDYWQPLYGFVRRNGYDLHAAQDLTQAFFERLLDKNYLEAANRERGRFRSFLLASLKHFLANERKAARAQKRGGGAAHLSIDFQRAEEAYLAEPADERTAEQIFEQQWAVLLLERVLARVAEDFDRTGKTAEFAQLKDCLAAGQAHRPYAEIAAELGTSEAAVKMAVHRLRKRYRELLREEVALTVVDADDVEDELRQLFTTLAG